MGSETSYRIALAVLCLLGLSIRVYYHRLATRTAGRVWYKEGWLSVAFQRGCEWTGMALVIGYLLSPPHLSWAALSLPGWLRWLGVLPGFGGLVLLGWTHGALGTNFAPVLHVRQQQTLVTTGPYHWIRHPMYTSMYLITAGIFLLSALWVVGILYWISLTLVLLARVGREEALMAETFGEEYRVHVARTGRFLPRLFGQDSKEKKP